MANDVPQVSITATRKIAKYAEGVDPEIGEPFEVLTHTEVLVGKEAEDYLKSLGGEVNGTA